MRSRLLVSLTLATLVWAALFPASTAQSQTVDPIAFRTQRTESPADIVTLRGSLVIDGVQARQRSLKRFLLTGLVIGSLTGIAAGTVVAATAKCRDCIIPPVIAIPYFGIIGAVAGTVVGAIAYFGDEDRKPERELKPVLPVSLREKQ